MDAYMARPQSSRDEAWVMDEKAWWIALHMVPGVGRITFKKLVEYFGHPRAVLQATAGQLTRVSGIGPKIAAAPATNPECCRRFDDTSESFRR